MTVTPGKEAKRLVGCSLHLTFERKVEIDLAETNNDLVTKTKKKIISLVKSDKKNNGFYLNNKQTIILRNKLEFKIRSYNKKRNTFKGIEVFEGDYPTSGTEIEVKVDEIVRYYQEIY